LQKKIILADDNRTFLMYVGLLLKRFGFQVLPADNGLEVLRMIRLMGADLIILDVHMDTVDGMTTLRHIKADKNSANIPVIMISTDMAPETIKACKDLGCDDYLAKPVKVDRLHDAVQRCFFSHGRPNRRHIRTSFREKVSVDCDGIRYDLYAETLSAGGVYVKKEYPIPVGSDVEVTFHLDDGKPRHIKGKVIYTKERYGDFSTLAPGMAIQFQDLPDQDYQDMHDYLKTLVAGDIMTAQGERVLER
jgi:CheY-like chemotaxis protein/Tfp pilus assembly protein PilZ